MAAGSREVILDLGLDEPQDPAALRARVAQNLGLPEADLPPVSLRKKSIDARGGAVRFHLLVEIDPPPQTELGIPHPRPVGTPRAIIVGDGPAGLFAPISSRATG